MSNVGVTATRKELARLIARGAREVEAERRRAAFTRVTKIEGDLPGRARVTIEDCVHVRCKDLDAAAKAVQQAYDAFEVESDPKERCYAKIRMLLEALEEALRYLEHVGDTSAAEKARAAIAKAKGQA